MEYINYIIIIILCIIISIYAIDMTRPYPRIIIELYNEPYIRFGSYMLVYALSFYNKQISFLLLIGLLFLHFDLINLVI